MRSTQKTKLTLRGKDKKGISNNTTQTSTYDSTHFISHPSVPAPAAPTPLPPPLPPFAQALTRLSGSKMKLKRSFWWLQPRRSLVSRTRRTPLHFLPLFLRHPLERRKKTPPLRRRRRQLAPRLLAVWLPQWSLLPPQPIESQRHCSRALFLHCCNCRHCCCCRCCQ